jgi:signal peptidase I
MQKVIDLKKLWKNDYFKTALTIALIIAVIIGFYAGIALALGTLVPIRVVESGSMCVPYNVACDGWLSVDHPFAQTLHKGDIIIIQAVNPTDLNANYPNSDIIVYKNPNDDKSIVHRIVEKQEINGTLYFKTKGDSNSPIKYPEVSNNYDNIPDSRGVPQNLIEGKVILRIPWFGWITLFMRGNDWALPLVVALIILLVVIEFVLPLVKEKRKRTAQQTLKDWCAIDVFIKKAFDKRTFKKREL